MSNRIEKLNELFKEEISTVLNKTILDKSEGLVTITEVQTAVDLKDATVWISVLGGDVDKVVEFLNKKAWNIKNKLKERDLVMRYLPNLHFKPDHTAEKAARVEMLLEEIRKEKK